MCKEEARSLPLEWSEYREHGTEFIKASTKPNSIAKQLNKVYLMPIEKRKEWGKKAREWTIENYSAEVIGQEIEKFIDSASFLEEDFSFEDLKKDPYVEIPEIKKSSNTIFQMWNKWCEETKIRVEYNKIQFGIKFTQIVKKKFTQKDKSYIKRDQNNQITTFYIPELKEYFKELNKNDFIDEDE
jgi:hypothetical protein